LTAAEKLGGTFGFPLNKIINTPIPTVIIIA